MLTSVAMVMLCMEDPLAILQSPNQVCLNLHEKSCQTEGQHVHHLHIYAGCAVREL